MRVEHVRHFISRRYSASVCSVEADSVQWLHLPCVRALSVFPFFDALGQAAREQDTEYLWTVDWVDIIGTTQTSQLRSKDVFTRVRIGFLNINIHNSTHGTPSDGTLKSLNFNFPNSRPGNP